MAFVTYKRVRTIQNNRDIEATGIANHDLWGVLASLIITPIMIIIVFGLGTFTLFTKSVKESGFTYVLGVLHISIIWLALLLLLSSVTQNAYNDDSQNLWREFPTLQWGGEDSSLFQATWVLGYVLLCFYVALFIIIFVLKSSLKRLNLDSEHGSITTAAGGVKGAEMV